MGKYQVEHTCGHTEVVELFGPCKQRDATVERLSARVCADCYREQARQADQQLIDAVNAEVSLPELIGTPKQVEWAEAIRAKAYNAFKVTLACAPDNDTMKRKVDAIMANQSAKWWIDNRNNIRLF